jgi:hypothetical protein
MYEGLRRLGMRVRTWRMMALLLPSLTGLVLKDSLERVYHARVISAKDH